VGGAEAKLVLTEKDVAGLRGGECIREDVNLTPQNLSVTNP